MVLDCGSGTAGPRLIMKIKPISIDAAKGLINQACISYLTHQSLKKTYTLLYGQLHPTPPANEAISVNPKLKYVLVELEKKLLVIAMSLFINLLQEPVIAKK